MDVTTAPRNTRLPFPFHPGKSALERHGIDHLSASSLNAWIASPSLWIMERLLGRRGPANCSMHRGTAIEDGVSLGLFAETPDLSACVARALNTYDALAATSGDPKRADERAVIPAMVRQGFQALAGFGRPIAPEGNAKQHRIVVRLEDVPVPLIGFLDFYFPPIADLKTTLRVPTSFGDAHRRQGALYQHAHGNAGVVFAYCSEKKWAHLSLDRDGYEQGIRELRHAALRLERFLGLSDDPHELAEIVTPDFGTFHWNDPQTRALGRQTYGF